MHEAFLHGYLWKTKKSKQPLQNKLLQGEAVVILTVNKSKILPLKTEMHMKKKSIIAA